MNLHATTRGGPTCLTTNWLKRGFFGLYTWSTSLFLRMISVSFSNLNVAMALPPPIEEYGQPVLHSTPRCGIDWSPVWLRNIELIPCPHELLKLWHKEALVAARIRLGPQVGVPGQSPQRHGPHPQQPTWTTWTAIRHRLPSQKGIVDRAWIDFDLELLLLMRFKRSPIDSVRLFFVFYLFFYLFKKIV